CGALGGRARRAYREHACPLREREEAREKLRTTAFTCVSRGWPCHCGPARLRKDVRSYRALPDGDRDIACRRRPRADLGASVPNDSASRAANGRGDALAERRERDRRLLLYEAPSPGRLERPGGATSVPPPGMALRWLALGDQRRHAGADSAP